VEFCPECWDQVRKKTFLLIGPGDGDFNMLMGEFMKAGITGCQSR
jgi:hypothetical protein